MNVKRVTSKYIFYEDGTRERANSQNLLPILDESRKDVIFYSRMYYELHTMYNKATVNIKFGTQAADQNNFYERVGALGGLSDAMTEASNQLRAAEEIQMQCRRALGMEVNTI